MASIYSKRKILYLGWYEELLSGERIHRSRSLKLKDTRENRKTANLIKKQKENMLLFSTNKVQRKITINEAFKKFIETKKSNASKTRMFYCDSLRILNREYGNVDVNKIGKDEINKIVEKMEYLSEESINSYKRGIKIFFNYLIDENYYKEKNPIGKLRATRKKKSEIISDEELEELLDFFNGRNKEHYDLIKLLVLTGFRISEAIALEWEDIKVDHIIVKNKKAKRNDYFPLTDEIKDHLSTIEKNGAKVFRYNKTSQVRYINKLISRETNKKYSFHSFRKKFATEWSRFLMPAELKEVMRHGEIRTTMQYYVGLNIVKIGEKMTGAKWKLKEKKKAEKCEIIDIKKAKNSLIKAEMG